MPMYTNTKFGKDVLKDTLRLAIHQEFGYIFKTVIGFVLNYKIFDAPIEDIDHFEKKYKPEVHILIINSTSMKMEFRTLKMLRNSIL